MKLFKRKRNIMAFTNGKVIPLENVHDNMFSKGLIGPGIAIESIDGKYYCPVDGEITMLFPTLHALGIKTKNEELLLHIGIDTVDLESEGFTAYVQTGQKVMIGDLLLEVDLDILKSKGYYTEAVLCITEPKDIDPVFTNKETVSAIKDILISIK